MESCRKAVVVLVLAVVLSTSASAGIMHTDATTPPPPPTANGEMHTDMTQTGETDSTSEADALTGIALGLLHSVLTLF